MKKREAEAIAECIRYLFHEQHARRWYIDPRCVDIQTKIMVKALIKEEEW